MLTHYWNNKDIVTLIFETFNYRMTSMNGDKWYKNNNEFPYEIKFVEDKINQQLMKDFTGKPKIVLCISVFYQN